MQSELAARLERLLIVCLIASLSLFPQQKHDCMSSISAQNSVPNLPEQVEVSFQIFVHRPGSRCGHCHPDKGDDCAFCALSGFIRSQTLNNVLLQDFESMAQAVATSEKAKDRDADRPQCLQVVDIMHDPASVSSELQNRVTLFSQLVV